VSTIEHRKVDDAIDALPRGTYDDTEWAVRVELAALHRACALYGMSDLANGAIAARIPETGHFLLHPYGMYREEATASMFVTVDEHGTPVHGDSRWVNDGALNLCRWMFGTRPEMHWFVHGHEEPIVAVGSTEAGLLPVTQPAVYLGHMLGYVEFDFDEDAAFAERVCRAFASFNVVISRNHGHWSMGRTAGEAFFRAYFLLQACDIQCRVLAMGDPHLISPERVAAYQAQMYASPHYNYDGVTEWPGLLRKVARECPGFDT
jgi:ribulose-5-phosphate 4-epimerase/fuculose-1-phosphate aldolase